MKLRIIVSLGLAVFVGGVWAPPNAFCQHILFVAHASGRNCKVFDLDWEGNLTYRESFEIGSYATDIAVSANGRAVVVGSEGQPRLSTVFIGKEGLVSAPAYVNNPPLNVSYTAINPVAFHSTLPLIYAGYPMFSMIRYSEIDHTAELTSETLVSESGYDNWSEAIGYSKWADVLIHGWKSRPNDGTSGVRSVKLAADGSFTTQSSTIAWPEPWYMDIAVSPDGRWAAATGFTIHLIRIDSDGQLAMTDTDGEYAGGMMAVFTNDSRRLLVSREYGSSLILYEINDHTGQLIKKSSIPWNAPGWNMSTVLNVAITRDGKYAVFRSVHPKIFGYNIIHVVRIHEDGTLEYLHGKEVVVDHYIGPMAFTANPAYNAAGEWALYE